MESQPLANTLELSANPFFLQPPSTLKPDSSKFALSKLLVVVRVE